MLYSHTKPVNLLSSNLHYLKHKSELQNIETAPIHLYKTNPLEQNFKKIHNRSVSYHHHQQSSKISKQNQKIVVRLLSISHRKKGLIVGDRSQLKIRSFLSPARKKRERMITEENYNLAVKIINKRSQFDPQKIQKQIKDYEQLKKTLYNNKKLTTVSRLRATMMMNIQPSSNHSDKLKESYLTNLNQQSQNGQNVGNATEKKIRHLRLSSV